MRHFELNVKMYLAVCFSPSNRFKGRQPTRIDDNGGEVSVPTDGSYTK